MGEDPEDCQVCFATFNTGEQRPRSLPCGHTFCGVCVARLAKVDQVRCPTCGTTHATPVQGQFPVNYNLEAFIKKARHAASTAACPALSTGKGSGAAPALSSGQGSGAAPALSSEHESAGLSSKMRLLLEEQEARVSAAISTYQEVRSRLVQYQTFITTWEQQQQQLENRLQAVMDHSRSMRVFVQQQESQVAARKAQLHQGQQRLQTLLKTVRSVTTERDVAAAIVDVADCTDETDKTVKESLQMFPDLDTITAFRKAMEAAKATVESMHAMHTAVVTMGLHNGAAGQVVRPAACVSSVTGRLHTLKLDDLHTLRQPARSLLEAGQLFVVHQTEGQIRYAKIGFQDGRLYLHSLREEAEPPGTAILQISEIEQPSPPCLVFLDLAWHGGAPGRVHIRLIPNTKRGKEFVLLCSGQRGPSYANTTFFRVVDRKKPGECVAGGDYERNDGKGGAALLPGIDNSEYLESGRAGAVWGWWGYPDRGAQFAITTRDRQGDDVFCRVFGHVVKGLEVVAEAARTKDIKSVTVVDCGVVL